MSYQDWKDKTAAFKKIDVRGVQGNFFQGLKKQAMQLPAGSDPGRISRFCTVVSDSFFISEKVEKI